MTIATKHPNDSKTTIMIYWALTLLKPVRIKHRLDTLCDNWKYLSFFLIWQTLLIIHSNNFFRYQSYDGPDLMPFTHTHSCMKKSLQMCTLKRIRGIQLFLRVHVCVKSITCGPSYDHNGKEVYVLDWLYLHTHTQLFLLSHTKELGLLTSETKSVQRTHYQHTLLCRSGIELNWMKATAG